MSIIVRLRAKRRWRDLLSAQTATERQEKEKDFLIWWKDYLFSGEKKLVEHRNINNFSWFPSFFFSSFFKATILQPSMKEGNQRKILWIIFNLTWGVCVRLWEKMFILVNVWQIFSVCYDIPLCIGSYFSEVFVLHTSFVFLLLRYFEVKCLMRMKGTPLKTGLKKWWKNETKPNVNCENDC